MTQEFITYQCVVQYRQPINEDGSLGHPQIVKRFVSEIKGKKATYVKSKKEISTKKKVEAKKATNDLFKMSVSKTETL